MALLEVQGLRTEFATDDGSFRAVDGVSFSVEAGRTLAIVGESGCGKSVTALSIMGLVPDPPGRITAGSIRLHGRELVGAPARDLLDLRGNGMAMIFQEPMTSLNPAFTIGEQIVEGLLRHQSLTRPQARERALEVLRQVRIPAPEQRYDEHPHKLSGGMRQRAMIAMALACKPQLLIADEPTTALDVTIQAQILELVHTLRQETGTAVILITHDLGVVAEVADEVAVMYAGRIVEQAPVQALFEQPQHPYTIGLLGSIPRLDVAQHRLAAIEGQVPNPLRRPPGCQFADRCPFVVARCRAEEPPLALVGGASVDGGAPASTSSARTVGGRSEAVGGTSQAVAGSAQAVAESAQAVGGAGQPAGGSAQAGAGSALGSVRTGDGSGRPGEHRSACWRAPLDPDVLVPHMPQAVVA